MKYAVEYNVYSIEDNKKFEGVYFDAEECIDIEEFNNIVKGKTDIIIEDFETSGSHTNEDKTQTAVMYTRGYIETEKDENYIIKLIKDIENK
tara:strand:+ start:615 stop:890 length:276 start_codon:yes stop_codon:yes gene_type:complete